MLDIIRNLVSSIFGKILLALMVLSFALWGVGDILTSGNSRLAAKVGDEKISLEDFYINFQQTLRDISNSSGMNISMQQAKDQQLDKIMLNEMIYQKMISDFAKKQGVIINDEVLKDYVMTMDEFKNNAGQFNDLLYKNYIQNNFNSESAFLNEMESILLRNLLFENFNINNSINDKLITILYNHEGKKIDIEYFIIDDSKIAVSINEIELREYYDNNKEKYRVPKKEYVNYLNVGFEKFRELVEIDNIELESFYESNIQNYTTKESRDVEFVRVPTEEKAFEIAQKWESYDNEAFRSFAANEDFEIFEINELGRDRFSEDVSNKIFILDLNNISDPIQIADAGFYIFKITSVSEEAVISFEDAKNEIEEELSNQIAYELYDEYINEVDMQLINGAGFDEIVTQSSEILNLNIDDLLFQNIEYSDFKDMLNNNAAFVRLKAVGEMSDLILTDTSMYIHEISSIKESYIKAYKNIIKEVTDDLTKEKKEQVIEKILNRVLVELQFTDYESFKNYTISKNYNLNKATNIDRNNANDADLTTESISELFNLGLNNLSIVRTNDNQLGVAFIKNISEPKDRISSNFFEEVKENIIQNYNNSLNGAIGNKIIENTPYEIFNQNIENILM